MLEAVDSSTSSPFVIVGVGASAGGLDAFSQLLRHIPETTGMAFVLIQHLDPKHASSLAEALANATAMSVRQVDQRLAVEPNHVYAIAPDTDLAIDAGWLVPSPRSTDATKPNLPIDIFFRSLAAERGTHAIGVVLSGGASDGTEGLRAIRTADGIAFAQDPRSAKFSSMPQSAVDAGVIDHCMEIPELAAELVRLSRHVYIRANVGEPPADEVDLRATIMARVLRVTGTDFSEFKPASVMRRLARRIALRGAVDLQAYLALLDAQPEEVRLLHEDLLIHVTSFFRNPEVFESLCTQVFPEILKHKLDGAPIRVWVAGCSTGEEVYSLAIVLLEYLGESEGRHPVQIFGSDLSDVAIQKARAGSYGEHAMRDVSEERRRRFFVQHEDGHRIHEHVRERCVFVRHDLACDPPFSKLDLLSCRNVLIYFDQVLQHRVLPALHYCLNQPGFLLLGRSENIASYSQLFAKVDGPHKIYRRTSAVSQLRFAARPRVNSVPSRTVEQESETPRGHSALQAKQVDRLLLARYCPSGVLVNENMDVLLFRGQTGSFLQAAPGQPQNNLMGMARGGLQAVLRETIAEAKREKVVARRSDIEVEQNGAIHRCDVVVIPLSNLPDGAEALFVVLFEESPARDAPALPARPEETPDASQAQRRIARIEHELAGTKEYLHILIEEHGRTNDELGISNEELISGNEELQSMNEELETAKEELQSTNEELTSLNDELQRRNQEMTQVNADLLNFSLTVDIAILRLDMERRIRRTTPKAHAILNVSPTDIGRAIDDIDLPIAVPNLSEQIAAVISSRTVREVEVQDLNGHWYRMQIRPYVTIEQNVEGALLAFIDIDELKRLASDAERARSDAERASSAKDDFLATLSHELRTPLSSMLLNAQRLRDGDQDRAALVRIGDSMERAVRQQVGLIDDLLDISRIVAGKLSLDCSALDLVEQVRVAFDVLKPLFDAKQLVVKLSLSKGLAPIWADPLRVQQIVANLITNTIKFTPRLGHVTLQVDGVDDYARLRVTDSGVGIEPKFLPHVFARFSQSDSSITRTHGGLGLGLALVRHLVELQGGTASAQSAGVGRGATFSVTFPFARASDMAEPAPATASRRPHALDRPGRTAQYSALNGVRVLFIDDDLRTREAVLEVLQFTGAQVALAASAADGIMAIDSFKPQIVVCDIAMPGEDGYSFVRKLRARELGRSVPIPALALTALATADDKRRAIAAGFQSHLAKPIDIDRLRDAVLALAIEAAAPSA